MSWPTVSLDEVSEYIKNGASIKQSKDASGLPVTRIETIAEREVNLDKCGYANIGDDEYRNYRLSAGDILISHINSESHLGKCAIYESIRNDVVHGMNLLCLRPVRDKVFPKYLFYCISSQHFMRFLPAITKKSVNQASFTVNAFKGLEVPLPPLREQKRIASILDKADAIRRKRRRAMQLADEFLRAMFLDMFGDPVTNPKEWEEKPLKQLAKVTTGNTPSRKEEKFYGDHIEWIKSDNINTPSHFLTRASESLSAEGKKVARVVGKGSILVTCIAGSFDCIGNAAYADREVAFNQQINALTPLSSVTSWFLYALILFSKKKIQSASTNSMKGMVSKGKMEEVTMICPPLSIQEKFQEAFIKFLTVNENLDCAFAGATDVFDSLSQRAFSGEL